MVVVAAFVIFGNYLLFNLLIHFLNLSSFSTRKLSL